MAKLQVQTFVQVLLLGYLAAMSLRGGRDYRTLGRLIVAAAALRSVYVLVAARYIAAELGTEEVHAAATHGDSLLFACATVLDGEASSADLRPGPLAGISRRNEPAWRTRLSHAGSSHRRGSRAPIGVRPRGGAIYRRRVGDGGSPCRSHAW